MHSPTPPRAPDPQACAQFRAWFAGSTVLHPATGAARILYHGTRAKFTRFDVARIEHFGFHLGTRAQALKFGKHLMALYARIEKPIRLPDLGTWGFENVARHLDRRGLGLIDEADYERAWNAFDQSAELRAILLQKGWDGIVYANEVEGRGDSFIVFEPGQILLAERTHHPDDPGVLHAGPASALQAGPAVASQDDEAMPLPIG